MIQDTTLARIAHTSVTFNDGLTLDCGATLPTHTVAYRTYGSLNADRTNAILICHALTLDQYVAEPHPLTAPIVTASPGAPISPRSPFGTWSAPRNG